MSPYSSRYWVTFKQAKTLGGCVRKGEKGWPIIVWKFYPRKVKDAAGGVVMGKDGKPKRETTPMLRYYTVFNLDQCDGVADPDGPVEAIEHDSIEAAEAIVRNMPQRPAIHQGGGRACYSPSADRVSVPELGHFDVAAEFYSTMFHELAHSTGHPDRLNRPSLTGFANFGDHAYSKEELVAEMTAAFLCQRAGILPLTVDNSAAYLRGWMRRLKDNPKWFVQAGGLAQKAADFILLEQWQEDTGGDAAAA